MKRSLFGFGIVLALLVAFTLSIRMLSSKRAGRFAAIQSLVRERIHESKVIAKFGQPNVRTTNTLGVVHHYWFTGGYREVWNGQELSGFDLLYQDSKLVQAVPALAGP